MSAKYNQIMGQYFDNIVLIFEIWTVFKLFASVHMHLYAISKLLFSWDSRVLHPLNNGCQ